MVPVYGLTGKVTPQTPRMSVALLPVLALAILAGEWLRVRSRRGVENRKSEEVETTWVSRA